jgi:ribosomal protein S18 acetylase RimI-like enzyme
MAAQLQPVLPQVLDLRRVDVSLLRPVLDEEIDEWRLRAGWNYRPSIELVERFVYLHTLQGFALVLGGAVIGYAYYVQEDRKALVGDLFVARRYRGFEYENLLLDALLGEFMRDPSVRRVESQVMLLAHQMTRPWPYAANLQRYERYFMELTLPGQGFPPERGAVEYWPFQPRHVDAAGALMAQAYKGHVDSRINDQYRSVAGARQFLQNILQYPGCGAFFAPASFVATTAAGDLVGMCLASVVGPQFGHISQICVANPWRGSGVAYGLMRRSLEILRAQGCRAASLTVTAANEPALALYRRLGFQVKFSFAACVWEQFAE